MHQRDSFRVKQPKTFSKMSGKYGKKTGINGKKMKNL